MPELPEVESLRRMLVHSVVGRRIDAVAVRERRLRRPLAADFVSQITGATIKTIRRRAKYLLLELENGLVLLVHLGMSGSLTHRGAGFAEADFDPRHDHVRLTLDDGTALVYNDPRRFGLMKLAAAGEVAELPELKELGPEPLDASFNCQYLTRLARGRRVAIKSLLMDQRVVAGIGNIYASEILFLAKVRPGRRAGSLTRMELAHIVEATPRVLRAAIGRGGTTFRNYRDSRGRPGRFARRLQVYGRDGQRCYVCGGTVRNRVIGQRASFYCATCQR